jgi:hypothetical protein
MLHRSQAHVCANLFTETNQCDTDDGSDLIESLLFVLFVLCAQVKHLLNLEHIARAGIGASLQHQLNKGRELLILDDFTDLHRRLSLRLLTQEQKAETQSENSSEWVVELLFIFLHEDLQNRLCDIIIARAHEDQTQTQGTDGLQSGRVILIEDDWCDDLEQVSACGRSVSE